MRETLEGQLGCLGNALNLVDLVAYRVGAAIQYTGQGRMLAPALDDLDHVKQLIIRAQVIIKTSNPTVFGGE